MNSVKLRLQIFLLVLLVIMVTGTFGFMIIEDLSPTDALYFSIVTVTTVGYGDIHPTTQTGKIFAIFLIITGVGTFLGVIANTTDLLLHKRENRIRMEKMNMFIGVFFSEIGTRLLAYFAEFDPKVDVLRKYLIVNADWSEQNFFKLQEQLKGYDYYIDAKKVNLENLRNLLNSKGDLLVRLLENPNLLEHQSFTALLWAVFHLKEELLTRKQFHDLPDTDYNHLSDDFRRAYSLLVIQWLDYLKHLKVKYPYLFSLAMRTNPFDKDVSPIVT